jgi:hypothetical protein
MFGQPWPMAPIYFLPVTALRSFFLIQHTVNVQRGRWLAHPRNQVAPIVALRVLTFFNTVYRECPP